MKTIDSRTNDAQVQGPARQPSRPRPPEPAPASRADRIAEAIMANYVLAISTRGAH
jgi:hypothetical protein